MNIKALNKKSSQLKIEIIALYLHCTFQHLLFSHRVKTTRKDRHTHTTNTHDDYRMPLNLRPLRHNDVHMFGLVFFECCWTYDLTNVSCDGSLSDNKTVVPLHFDCFNSLINCLKLCLLKALITLFVSYALIIKGMLIYSIKLKVHVCDTHQEFIINSCTYQLMVFCIECRTLSECTHFTDEMCQLYIRGAYNVHTSNY